ncbi:MAG: hypothetical protein DCC67_02180 [Planctomycetota bacterium]|nr:MAG: hypothetical protein DCC67_02180 [Planctomycetota bacterium]
MQRYRVNYPLLIGLVVGFFAFSGAAYGLWRFQVNRNADYLVQKAEAAEAEGKLDEAFKSLLQYVKLRRDDFQQWVRLGEISAKISDMPEPDSKLLSDAYQVLVMAVRETDNLGKQQNAPDPGLRRKLVDLQIRYRMPELAYVNIDQLLKNGSQESELKALEAQCLFAMQKPAEGASKCYALIGYDPKTDQFDPARAEAPDKPVVYAMLAQYVRSRDQPELAERILQQMVASNPESREAYVLLYQFKKAIAIKEGLESEKGAAAQEAAVAALHKAYELEPTDAAVLSHMGAEAIGQYQQKMQDAQGPDAAERREAAKAHLDEAAKFYAEALERYPDRVDFYERVARVDMMREQIDNAFAVIERGIQKFPLRSKTDATGLPLAIILSNLKIEILIAQKKFDEVHKETKALREINNSQVKALADFFDARLLAINEKWSDAARTLQRVKPLMLSFPEQQALAGAVQGFCHTQLGQLDLALQAYEWALERNPQMPQALAGAAEIRHRRDPTAEEDENAPQFDQRVREMMARPQAEQDWESLYADVDKYVDTQAATRPVTPEWVASRKALLRGQIIAMRAAETTDQAEQKQLFQEARQRYTEAFKAAPEDPVVQMAAIRLLALEPGSGPTAALKRLDEVVADGKDSAQYRALRIELLFALRDEKLPEQLDAATQNMDQWQPSQQATVWSAAASRFEQIGRFADARRCLEKAAELAPQSLPTRMALFDLALRQNDDSAMRKAQEGVLAIVKDQNSPDYVLTEVKRRIAGQETGAATTQELQEARGMIDAALKKRPGWAELHVANAQLYVLLDKHPDQAIAAINQAIEQGGTNLNAIIVQIKLLAERGRLREAREAMNRLPQQAWTAVLGQGAAELLAAAGEVQQAFAEAEKFVKTRPDDHQVQVWFADMAAKAEKLETAEAAMKKALELNPSDPDLWTRMVGLYIQMKRPEDIERTLREAHLALDAEYLPLLTAKYYELQSRWQEAEDIYLAALGSRVGDVNVDRRLAEFYLLWTSKDAANRGKAAVYLNRILKASYEGKLADNDPNAIWARRQAARLLASTGDYRDSVKAERLLQSAIAGGAATPEDQAQLVNILTARQDPASRERAVALLRDIKKQYGNLTPEREIQLGQALLELGDWEGAKSEMTAAIEQYPDHLGLKTALVSMLITKKEFDEAQRWISRLQGVPGAEAPQAELRLRLASARGDMAEVRRTLTEMTPNLRQVTEEQLKVVRQVAQLADSVNDHQYALDLMRQYVSRASDGQLELARLTALYGDVNEGLAMLRQLEATHLDDVLTIAVEVLRARRAEAPEKLDEEVARLVRAGLRDDPENAKRMMNEAEMLDAQERYADSVAAYRKLLERDDVPPMIRAAAANNMAFIVALQNPNAEDLQRSLDAVNEAMELLGPLSDILDTRAQVYIAQKQFDQAAQDMRQAVKMNATPLKFFHLAVALHGAGDEEGAKTAWQRAKSEGLKLEEAPKLERPALEEFFRRMDGVAAQAKL